MQGKEEAAATLEGLLDRAEKALGDKVKEVRVTHRLAEFPDCLAFGDFVMSARKLVPNCKPAKL